MNGLNRGRYSAACSCLDVVDDVDVAGVDCQKGFGVHRITVRNVVQGFEIGWR